MPINFLVLAGGQGFLEGGGGGSANFIFMGVGIFPTKALNTEISMAPPASLCWEGL